MAQESSNSNWWIWKVFWILLVVTGVEVLLDYTTTFFIETIFLGTKLLNHIFIILTLVKAAYIVMVFMHLGHEVKGLRWVIIAPMFILIPYLLFILLVEGFSNYV